MVPINLFKSSYQSLYNSLKGGLDANTQQYVSIQPNVSVTFEQKYLLRMLLAGITNAWRAFQLMHLAERKSVITYHYKPNTDKASAEGNVRRTRISSAGGDVEEVATASVTRRKQKEPDAITVERRKKKIGPSMTAVKTTTLRRKMKGMQELNQNHKNQLNRQQQGQLNPQQRQESHQDQWLKRYGHRGLQEYQQPHQSVRQAPCRQSIAVMIDVNHN